MRLKIVRGSVEYENGDKWKGEFVDGQPGGQGKHTFADGDVYEGRLVDGAPNGSGKMKYAAGGEFNYYRGDWENGKLHGNGTLKWIDGSMYVGEFQRQNLHGTGKMRYSNGGVYEGRWEDGKPNGVGKMEYAAGRKVKYYEGEWVNGKQHGYGTMKWVDGSVHAGEWLNGRRHGNGTCTYTDGRVYTGAWANGKKHGSGIMTEANGDELKQEYNHGQLLSSKRVATLSNGPPSQCPRIGNAVNDMFLLNEDYTTCDICMERFSFDRNTEYDNVKKRLPVLSKSCDHWCCHGCVLKEQTRRAGLAEDGASPTWIPCMKCRSEDAFCPSEPRYDRRLIDMLSSSIPVRGCFYRCGKR
ncbi:hypothetical protein ACHAXT_001626 [Thalassiosira profunda]